MALSNAVIIGQIGAPHGVKGWIHVRSFTEPSNNLKNFSEWNLFLRDQKNSKVLKVEEIREHSNHFIVKLKDIEDRDTAASFTNCKIAIERDTLPKLNDKEYYLADLLGMSVYNEAENGQLIGVVTDFFETAASDILVIKGEKEYLIPCVLGEHIVDICLNKKEIRVTWNVEL